MLDTRTAPYGLFLLRVALGVMFVAHALLKYFVFTLPGFAGFLTQAGFPAAFAWPVFLAELAGGIALIVGFYGRWVALALLPVLLGALLVHLGNGWLFTAPCR
jgi:putative oxidoreductase